MEYLLSVYICDIKIKTSKLEHCLKIVRVRSFSGPYSVQMRENMDQKNSKHGLFLRSVNIDKQLPWKSREKLKLDSCII